MNRNARTAWVDVDEMLAGILEWVDIETPTHDGKAVNRLMDRVEEAMRALGTRIERKAGRDGLGDMLKVRSPWGGDAPGILVLSHLDTVYAAGTKDDALPIRRDGDRVYGPGIYDMKAGAYIAYYAFRHLVRQGKTPPLPITFLYTPDEEIGSPISRAWIEEEARRNKHVLVTEPCRDGGKVVIARNGTARFFVRVTGRPAHSGARHMDGRSAIKEMAHQVLRFEALTDYAQGITASVGTIRGGTRINVIPAECQAEVDVRVPTAEAAAQLLEQVKGFRTFDPDCAIKITGGIERPPFDKFPGTEQLFQHAKQLAADIGFELEGIKTGGASDGNFTAVLGIPTLDGLGADGYGAHSFEEHILYPSLPDRTTLMIRLFETLQ